MEQRIITEIRYPNTTYGENQISYRLAKDDIYFVKTTKNGEMALVNWIEVWRDKRCIAEIKESVCDIYY